MTAEAPEVQVEDIQWTQAVPEVTALPAGKHHRPEPRADSTVSTDVDDQVPEDIREIPAEPRLGVSQPKPGRPASRRRAAIPATPKASKAAPPPSANAPNFGEWTEYLSDFALKWVTRAWIAWVFRGIDRYSDVAPQDNAALEMDPKTLRDVAKPIAHMAARSKFGNKYGRVLMDSSDGIAAIIQLTMWANRVSRIAKKYRPERHHGEHRVVPGEVIRDDSGAEGGSTIPSETFVANPGFNPSGHGFN